MKKFRVAVVARAWAVLPNVSPLIDLAATVIEMDADSHKEAIEWAQREFVSNLYDDRGGGPLWVSPGHRSNGGKRLS